MCGLLFDQIIRTAAAPRTLGPFGPRRWPGVRLEGRVGTDAKWGRLRGRPALSPVPVRTTVRAPRGQGIGLARDRACAAFGPPACPTRSAPCGTGPDLATRPACSVRPTRRPKSPECSAPPCHGSGVADLRFAAPRCAAQSARPRRRSASSWAVASRACTSTRALPTRISAAADHGCSTCRAAARVTRTSPSTPGSPARSRAASTVVRTWTSAFSPTSPATRTPARHVTCSL